MESVINMYAAEHWLKILLLSGLVPFCSLISQANNGLVTFVVENDAPVDGADSTVAGKERSVACSRSSGMAYIKV